MQSNRKWYQVKVDNHVHAGKPVANGAKILLTEDAAARLGTNVVVATTEPNGPTHKPDGSLIIAPKAATQAPSPAQAPQVGAPKSGDASEAAHVAKHEGR